MLLKQIVATHPENHPTATEQKKRVVGLQFAVNSMQM